MLKLYERYEQQKMLFIVLSVSIVLVAMYFTKIVVDKLAKEEKHKMEVWAEATRQLAIADEDADMTLVLKVLNGNNSVPVVIVDQHDKLVNEDYGIRNIEVPEENKDQFIEEKIKELKYKHPPITIEIDPLTKYFVYYDESYIIKNLSFFTFLIIGSCVVFLIIAFIAFGKTKKAEQNQIWVGFSKETAHQLGTPISSLLAWTEILKSMRVDPKILAEMSADINRLSIIAERFSKIGSRPTLDEVSMVSAIEKAVLYIKNRASKKVVFTITYHIPLDLHVKLNNSLFEWVIENLCKNAIDAMDGEGKIDIEVGELHEYVTIDIKDTGKGIPKSKFKTVFNPGYTTKKRGWGLGLSFVKRIVTNYHAGKVFVKQSELNSGTTFRILLRKMQEKK